MKVSNVVKEDLNNKMTFNKDINKEFKKAV